MYAGIGGTRFISFEGRHWHNNCFVCSSCKTSMVGKGFITDAEDIICPECAKKKLMADTVEQWIIRRDMPNFCSNIQCRTTQFNKHLLVLQYILTDNKRIPTEEVTCCKLYWSFYLINLQLFLVSSSHICIMCIPF